MKYKPVDAAGGEKKSLRAISSFYVVSNKTKFILWGIFFYLGWGDLEVDLLVTE